MAKKHPRATKRRPRAPQPLPKWSPRPSQIHFLSIFLILFSHTKFAWIFDGFLIDFCKLESLKIAIFRWKNNVFYKIAIFDKNTKNHRKTTPKSSRNPPKIDHKSVKIQKMRAKKQRWRKMRQKAPKIRKNCEKLTNIVPRASQKEHI